MQSLLFDIALDLKKKKRILNSFLYTSFWKEKKKKPTAQDSLGMQKPLSSSDI